MKRMTWKKTTSSEETYDVKKTTSFDETYEAKKGEKKSNVWGSILYFTEEAKIYLLSKIIFYHKTQNT